MDDLLVPLVRVAQELHISPDAARRAVLRAGPDVSVVRGRQRFVSMAWLNRAIVERDDLERGDQ